MQMSTQEQVFSVCFKGLRVLFSSNCITEPEGIVEIKMRKDKITSLMERLDGSYAAYKKASQDPASSAEERSAAATELSQRESDLMPTYKQIALLYADLHE
jgi:acetyl-CoA carboxylase / biotin carboxylase 1